MASEKEFVPKNDTFVILDLFLNNSSSELLNNVLEDLLQPLKQCNNNLLESCKILNTLLCSQRKHDKNFENVIMYEKIVNESLTLLPSIVESRTECCGLLIQVLENSLVLITTEKRSEIIINIVRELDKNVTEWTSLKDSTDLIKCDLYLLECLLNIFSDQICVKSTSKPLLDEFYSLLMKCVQALSCPPNNTNTPEILMLLFPKMLKMGNQRALMECMWKNLISSCDNSDFGNVMTSDNLTQILSILHGLSDYYLSSLEPTAFRIHCEQDFWKIIQIGMVNEEFILRKQALYLLKMTLSYFQSRSESYLALDIFWWDINFKETLITFWETLIITLEVLEEKQVHLVTPVFPMVDNLIKVCSVSFENNKAIDPSWFLCVIQRILKHDSNSIVKLGIIQFTSLDVCIYCHQGCYKRILGNVLNSINDMFLFTNTDNESVSIDRALASWFIKWSQCPHKTSFFNDLLKCIMEIPWGPIPLFYITYALSQIPPNPCLGRESLQLIKRFVSESLGTQNTFIRGAIQCRLLKSIYLLSRMEDLTLIDFADIFSCFKSSESLMRGTSVWNTCVLWLKSVFTKKDAQEFLDFCFSILFKTDCRVERNLVLSSLAMGKMVVMLYDAELIICTNKNIDFFENIYECFNGCDKRLYSCLNTQDVCLSFLVNVMNETFTKIEEQDFKDNYLLINISKSLPEIIKMIKLRMSSISNSSNVDTVETYVSLLEIVTTNKDLCKLVYVDLCELETVAEKIVIEFNSSLICIYFATKFLNCMFKIRLKSSDDIYRTQILKAVNTIISSHIMEGSINNKLKEMEDNNYKHGTQNSWGRLASGVIQGLWSIFDLFLSKSQLDSSNLFLDGSLNSIIISGSEAMSTGGRECVVYVLSVLKVILGREQIEKQTVEEIVATSWDTCFELRKTELFWLAIGKWIEMVYQKNIVEREDCYSVVLQYTGQLVQKGRNVIGLLNIFLTQLQRISTTTDLRDFSGIMVDLMLFGPLQKRDHKVELETCKFIQSLGSDYFTKESANDEYMDAEVRVKALDVVISSRQTHDLVFLVVEELICRNSKISQKNPRLYKDSELHRIKNRSLQALLVLETLIFEDQKPDYEGLPDKMFEFILESLMTESQQPSIRYQLEWLFIRLAIHYEHLRQDFWEIFDKAKTERIGSVCSFISIAFHMDKILQDDSFFELCVENILPWCMAQHFCVRLFAQTVLQKLWELHENVSEKYDLIKKSQFRVFKQGNTMTNIKKLHIDFYFNAFHPMEHYTLQTIFWDIPRLSNIASDEWVPLAILERCWVSVWEIIPKGCTQSGLSNYACSTWALKVEGEAIGGSGTDTRSGIQKKFVPWLSTWSESSEEKKLGRSGLVVVAALVDKPANLGGLARTCEVFSASCLVVPSLSLVQDKQFTSLSASSEKHLNITEVKPHNLTKYLHEMKKQGYTLVGAEQTSDSIPLSKFSFSSQTVLLLGNEKEGIPVNLLPLLDNCVEIPQFGLIRSLNVHVSGAIFVWEYAKQHRQLSNP